MNEIKCPACGKVFQVDESGYAQILHQVRDKEFEKEIASRLDAMDREKEKELTIMRMQQQKDYDDRLSEYESSLAEKDSMIKQLEERLSSSEKEKRYAVNEAVREKEIENDQIVGRKNDVIVDKDREIDRLKARIDALETEKQLAVRDAVGAKEKEVSAKAEEIIKLQSELSNKDNESRLKEQAIKDRYEQQLRTKDEQIEYYKDFKARQSTKMVGESLEQHCLSQFNTIRMTAFPNAYFEKDNDARTGSKGDFIFRESSEDGTEFISIMFEMKNEMDTTEKKHKNEDFFKELDKDRTEKGCEYAVLVSLLEIDNEYYNNGIVDVSYRYDKMYVVRPQFFIPIITLLRNAALNSLRYRRELQIVKNQQLDLMNFESEMQAFKDGFSRNYELASKKFKTAVEEIDKTIDHLQKTKDALLSSENNLRLANNKADDLSIKKLTKNAPSIREMFDELRKDGE